MPELQKYPALTNDATYGYIASAYSPLFDSTGTPVAVVGVDVFMPDLQKYPAVQIQKSI